MNDSTPAAPAPRLPGRPAGSRTGQSPARDRILEAARRQFSEGTYAATTVRAIAAEAGVNPALVNHHFGGKRYLFAAALRLPPHLREQVAALVRTDAGDMGENLVRLFLELWQAPASGAPLAAMIRSVFSDSEASNALGSFFAAEMIGPVVAACGHDQPHLRISLAASHLLGLAGARHVLGTTPLAGADTEHLVACVGPVVQHYLTGHLPSPGKS